MLILTAIISSKVLIHHRVTIISIGVTAILMILQHLLLLRSLTHASHSSPHTWIHSRTILMHIEALLGHHRSASAHPHPLLHHVMRLLSHHHVLLVHVHGGAHLLLLYRVLRGRGLHPVSRRVLRTLLQHLLEVGVSRYAHGVSLLVRHARGLHVSVTVARMKVIGDHGVAMTLRDHRPVHGNLRTDLLGHVSSTSRDRLGVGPGHSPSKFLL